MIKRECFANVNGVTDIIDIEVMEDFNAASTRFSFTTTNSSFSVNDNVDLVMGYDSDNATFVNDGYVDSVTAERPPAVYRIEGRDKLKKASDYFIVAATTDDADFFNPRLDNGSISPSDVIDDILAECGLTGLDYSSGDSGWELGNATDGTPFQLVSAWDAIQQICTIGVWKVWVEPNGDIHFDQVLTTPADTPSSSLTTGTGERLLSIEYSKSDEDLRNKIVVIGENGDYTATASVVSAYLPAGFYKTAVISTDLIGSQSMADDTAAINLDRFNKLTERVSFEAEGDPNIHVQDTVSITEGFTGVSGNWFIYEITHAIDESGYRMTGTGVK